MKIIVGTVISHAPYSPGKLWHRLHYIHGLKKLGHEVYLIEELKPNWCVDEKGRKVGFEQSINRKIFKTITERFGLVGKACLIYNQGEATFGLSFDSLINISKDSDLIINWSGHIQTERVLTNIKRRAYLDLDPVFTQLWHSEYGVDLNFKLHDVFFSVGLNIGTPYTSLPDCGIEWRHTLPPVVLEYWPFHVDATSTRFTTIASLKSYSDLLYQGEWHSSKYDEIKRFAELPRKVKQQLEIAVRYYDEWEENLKILKENGWFLSDAGKIYDMSSYQDYIKLSRAELSIVQNAYVKGKSGWFSDRWSHYLASGKPVLAQSTGFERCIPTGKGLLYFNTIEEAVEGVDKINRDYVAHCRSAREIAEEYLDYKKVLPRMLEACMAS